jgi:hypothetical protein
MFKQHFFQRHWRHAVVAMVVPALLACGKRRQEIDPSTFSAGWVSEDTEHFKVFDPPQSPRRAQLKAFAESCEEAYKDLSKLLSLTVPEKIAIYRFITNQDCEAATGHAAVFVEGYRIYTRIGSPVGGAIAVAAFTSVDPEAPSFELIRDGLREAFDNESNNIHGEAARLRSGGRWLPLSAIVNPASVSDREAYRLESASFVAYLIQTQGMDRFKMLWRSVLDLSSSLEKIYGGTLQEIEDDWVSHLEREAKRT